MSRLMSVSLTEQAVLDRIKHVTRRTGWWEDKNGRRLLKAGDTLTLCRKVMGRKKDEPLVRLVEVEVIDVRREPINAITDEDVLLEGFTFDDLREFDTHWGECGHAELTDGCCGIGDGRLGTAFVQYFLHHMNIPSGTEITRIEWKYLDDQEATR